MKSFLKLILIMAMVLTAGPGWGAETPYLGKLGGTTIGTGSCFLSQTVTWGSQPDAMTVGDSDKSLSGKATSEMTTAGRGSMVYTTNDAGICTIVSGALHAVGAGTCVVTATQAGDTKYCTANTNSGNVTISAATCAIQDLWTANTAAHYTDMSFAANHVAVDTTNHFAYPDIGGNWQIYEYYNVASLGSDDHYVQAYLTMDSNGYVPGVVLRCTPNGTSSTGYIVGSGASTTTLNFYKFSATTPTYIGAFAITGGWSHNSTHKLRVRVTGSDFYVWVDDVAASAKITDTTYTTGTYAGICITNGTAVVGAWYADTGTACMP
jgi:hypothetical protein